MPTASLTERSEQSIPKLTDILRADHAVVPLWACELEWYFSPADDAKAETVLEQLRNDEVVLRKEDGPGQHEAAWHPTKDAQILIEQVQTFRMALIETAKAEGLEVLFAAKPYPDEYGSAMQLHVHLENAGGERLYSKQSNALRFSLGGLLAALPESIPVFAPTDADYARFVPKQYAPTTVSWGGNNRTTALRVELRKGKHCHIEHRVPGANADVAAAIAVVLAGLLHGLKEECNPGEQVHGDASDAQYNLPKLPESREAALRALCEGSILLKYLGQMWVNAAIDAAAPPLR